MIEYSQKRLYVISNAILVEFYVSAILCSLLDIKQEESKTLGNKASSLTFRNKVELLSDSNYIDSALKTKLLKFAELRNQFAHNSEANDYTSTMGFLDGIENYLRKTYDIKMYSSLSNEDQLDKLYKLLFDDVYSSLSNLGVKVMTQTSDSGINIARLHIYETLINNLGAFISTSGNIETIKAFNEEILEAEKMLKQAGTDFNRELNLDQFKID